MALFIIGDTDSFWYPVELTQIGPNGTPSRHRVQFQFNRLDTDQLHARRLRRFSLALLRDAFRRLSRWT